MDILSAVAAPADLLFHEQMVSVAVSAAVFFYSIDKRQQGGGRAVWPGLGIQVPVKTDNPSYMKYSFLFLLIWLSGSRVFSQYKTLTESSLFKKDKVNLFWDSAGGTTYTLPHMDSLYQAGLAKFQIYSYHASGDSVFWHIRFISSLPSIRARWVGKPFPAAVFTDADHHLISTEKLRGWVLVVNCWSVSCGPCVAEIPDLNKLVDSLEEKKVVFLGLTFDKYPEIEAFLRSQKLKDLLRMEKPVFKFQLIGEQKDFLDHTLGVGAYPTTFIIGTDGIVRDVIIGVDLDKERKPRSYEKIRQSIDHLMQ